MQTGMLRWPILVTGLLVLAGCGRRIPAQQPFVFYDETGDPSERATSLSKRELREIISWVATQTLDPIWLIRVKWQHSEEKRGRVVAYIAPDEMTTRVRVGRAYDIPSSKKRTGVHSPEEYIQISVPGHTLTEDSSRPLPPELPFARPWVFDPNGRRDSPMSKEEVVAVVDLVREPSSYEGVQGWPETSRDAMIRGVVQSPIVGIERAGNLIDVQFGYIHGLWGYELSVTVECTPTGHKVKEWGVWQK